VGYPHPIKGEAIYAFVTLAEGAEMTPEIAKGLKMVRVTYLFEYVYIPVTCISICAFSVFCCIGAFMYICIHICTPLSRSLQALK